MLGAYYLLKLTPARTKPLSSENLLIFASSVVAGYPAAGLPRFSVCTKSPLTSGIGEGRCEGPWAIALKESGFDAVVCHGVADRPVSVLIDSGMVSFRDARPLWGTTTGTATDQLQEVFGPNSHVAAIGPAGENKVRFASIVTDRTHQVGRSGVGAVMGSKNLKAIVLRGGSLPPLAKSDVVATMTEAFGRRIKENPLSLWQKDPPGFAVWVHTHGLDASLDVNNYRNEDFPFSENYRPSEFLKFYHRHCILPWLPQ